MIRVLLPQAFATDRMERGLEIGIGRWQSKNFVAWLAPDLVAEIKSDAEYYASADGPDRCSPGLKLSAKATLRALAKAEAQP